MRKSAPLIFMAAGALAALGGCAGGASGGERSGLLGIGQREAATEAAQLGVNSYLWRATLDTLSFMPMAQSDPFGGTYVTEWYSAPERPAERFKVQVYILDTRLRADGLSVQVFRQTQGPGGVWADASVDPDTAVQIQNSILTRARQLRISSLESRR